MSTNAKSIDPEASLSRWTAEPCHKTLHPALRLEPFAGAHRAGLRPGWRRGQMTPLIFIENTTTYEMSIINRIVDPSPIPQGRRGIIAKFALTLFHEPAMANDQ